MSTDEYGITTLDSYDDPDTTPEKYLRGRSKVNGSAGYIHIDGYPYIRGQRNSDYVPIHRLVAVAEFGVSDVVEKHVHHKNGVRWDCRPENLELLSNSDHQRLENQNKPLSVRLDNATEEHVKKSLHRAGYEELAKVIDDE